jgi:Domain of unknown function (DUF6899)
MPYIERCDRIGLDKIVSQIPIIAMSSGDLNYLITTILLKYLRCVKNYQYSDLNIIIGVLECVKQEFYRRVVTPYEEEKRRENGDVY